MMEETKENYTCIYCGRVFSSLNALRSHLKWCPNRSLPREYSFGNWVFTCYMNPRKRITRALESLTRMNDMDERQFMGALRAYKESGDIHRFQSRKRTNEK